MKLTRLGQVVGLGWGEKLLEGKQANIMAGNAVELATKARPAGSCYTLERQLGFNVSFATNADLASAIATSSNTDFLVLMSTMENQALTDLTPVAGLGNLTALYMWCLAGVEDLSPLANLSQLRQLSMKLCTGVSDLSPLAKLSNLRYLDISGCGNISDLSPVEGLAKAVEIVQL